MKLLRRNALKARGVHAASPTRVCMLEDLVCLRLENMKRPDGRAPGVGPYGRGLRRLTILRGLQQI
jgi:hypothetical protein